METNNGNHNNNNNNNNGSGNSKKSSSRLESIEKMKLDRQRRLVEYFVVVSSQEATTTPTKNSDPTAATAASKTSSNDTVEWQDDNEYGVSFRPRITARYPLTDHADNPLHENVTFFCHPSGGIQLRQVDEMPKVHYFVATGGTGRQVYGTCLTLWEPYTLQGTNNHTNTNTTTAGQPPTTVYLPKCLVILSVYPYLIAFREYLTQLTRLCKIGMPLPIERYIVNFSGEVPAPPPGAFEVQTTILDSVIKIWSPPHNLPIAWVSLPFQPLFECLDIDQIVLVWQCLILERQVLITSTQLSLLTLSCEIFLSLLFPLRWSHAYIPVLPHILIPILSAPMPFLCGIHKANLADALFDLSRDCVLVDLDKNTVTLGPDTQALPPLPPQCDAQLRAQLQHQGGDRIFREARSLTARDDYSESGAYLLPHVKLMADALWESKLCLSDEAFHLTFTPDAARKNYLNGNDYFFGMDQSSGNLPLGAALSSPSRQQSEWDAIQEAFLDTFVYLLRNYRKFLVFPSKHNEGSYGGAGFRSKEFIESQRFDMRECLEQFISTQMFDNFITKRLYGSGEADVAFFDLAVDRFLKNAGLFADVDLSGRLLEASGFNKRGENSNSSSSAAKSSRSSFSTTSSSLLLRSTTVRLNENPLLQSAHIHRKLKTIVPPEPTGEGLPELLLNPEKSTLPSDTTGSRSSLDEDDAESMNSASSRSRSTTSNTSAAARGAPPRSISSISSQASKSSKPAVRLFKYPTFPSELNAELFGTPRPLPSAVIAEFDRQRKDAAQFRRKGPKIPPPEAATNSHFHYRRRGAHSALMDPTPSPPNPEVATFTTFFTAFTAVVGKDLVDMAKDDEVSNNDRTILSTYVPTSSTSASMAFMADDIDANTDGESDAGDQSSKATVEDLEEKAHVAEMKSSRPSMGGMFDDDDDEYDGDDQHQNNHHHHHHHHNHDRIGLVGFADTVQGLASMSMTRQLTDLVIKKDTENLGYDDDDDDENVNEGDSPSTKTDDSQSQRKRFRGKLSDAQIEEAKATGRAQLGLAFEMLTMMKKRALKADPEAYQCLIDACGRVGDTKRATDLLAKMHEDGIVADGTVYACLVSAFSAASAWKDAKSKEELPEWANSTAVEMDWNRMQKRSLFDRMMGKGIDVDDEEEGENDGISHFQKIRNALTRRSGSKDASSTISTNSSSNNGTVNSSKKDEIGMEFFVTETVERQIALGENLLEIVFPDISIDTDNEVCPRCNFLLSDDDVVVGWISDSNDYTTACPNCTQRFVPHFKVQCSSPSFIGSKGAASPLLCERLSPWVLQKEIRSVMSESEGIDNLLSPQWREQEYKNSVLWWNLVLSCMRYRFPFSFLLQGSFDQNLIAPLPEDE